MTNENVLLSRIRWLGLPAAAGAALYLCWRILLPFVDVPAWAAVLVILFYPLHRRIAARLGHPDHPGYSAIISSLLVIVVVLAPLTLITLAVVRELRETGQGLQANLNHLLDPGSPII
ncbi:MAG TPA: hypothetical protein PLD20_23525 [Blastocatellia bacterium]|nr:hypothetical protein [Blastocatellia bacterium]HMX29234.1 hypothetical protein [Blastocatellia bacterium]HMY75223.1 hypothetical protein [Blastocatellia bacterium]HMZ20923.1 hypothetical protein [Blastocatellia bacterium]HNG34138.1 hypothetical protein [Blastocatellia bacterium]